MKIKKTKIFLTLSIIYLLILFVSGEVIVRYFFTNSISEIKYLERNHFYTYPITDEFIYKNEDNKAIKVSTDIYGLRNLNIDMSNNIIVLGDSFISAVNTENNETFASRINGYNAGVDGYSTFQSLRLLNMLLKEASPKTVILGFYLGNDFRDNYLDKGQKKLNNFEIKSNLGSFSSTNSIKKLLKKSELIKEVYGFIKSLSKVPSMSSYTASEIYSYLDKPNEEFKIALKNTEDALGVLKEMSEIYDFRVVILGIPSKAQVYKSFKEITHYENDKNAKPLSVLAIKDGFNFDRPDKILSQISKKFNFQYISLLNHFRSKDSHNIYYYIDSHWTSIGQKMAYDLVTDNLK